VSGQVVENDVDVEFDGDVAVHLVQERDEVVADVLGPDVGDHRPGGDVQGGEEITGAVALVVMGGPRRGGGQHGQGWRRSVERLDLGFLVNREHRSGQRWVHIQGNEVTDLLHQVRIRRDLEGVLPPRLEPEGPPDLGHRLMADPMFGGKSPRRPVRGVGGRRLEGVDQDRFDDVVADRAYRSRTGRVDEPVETIRGKSVPPFRHRDRIDPQLRGDVAVGAALSAAQHDPAPQRQRLCRRMPAGPTLERLALLAAQLDLDRRSTTTCHRKLLLSGGST
jgi:hypothetical protein